VQLRSAAETGENPLPGSITALVIRRRKPVSKWNGNGGVRIIECPATSPPNFTWSKKEKIKFEEPSLTVNSQPSTNYGSTHPLILPARDPRTELQARLQNAPQEHAEALLAAYECCRDSTIAGYLKLLRGALGFE